MIWRKVYETIVEHVKMTTWAKCPQEFSRGGGYILEKFSGSFKMDLEDRLSLARWRGREQVSYSGELV